MRIKDTVSKDDRTNYKTNGFKVIEIISYNGESVVEKICAIDLDIFTAYALNIPLLVEKVLILFSRVPKGTAKTQSEEATGDCQNKLLGNYDDEATWEI